MHNNSKQSSITHTYLLTSPYVLRFVRDLRLRPTMATTKLCFIQSLMTDLSFYRSLRGKLSLQT
jgi:hypothetical protein